MATLALAGIPGTPIYTWAMSMAGMNPWLQCGLFIGGAIVVHSMAGKTFGAAFLFAFAVLWGVLSAPLILLAQQVAPDIIPTAALMTALIFTGLTAYVFKSGKDFGFLGGILWTGLIGLFAVALCGWLFEFNTGVWTSYFGVLLFAGFILYNTSNILKRYPTTAHVSAAMVLFVDVIMMFKNLLLILLSSRD